jgi:hypothetical protein
MEQTSPSMPKKRPAEVPKPVRIALVCEREISLLDARLPGCASGSERSKLLRARNDVRELLAFAVAQPEYALWLSQRPEGSQTRC